MEAKGIIGLNILGDRAFDTNALIVLVRQLVPAYCTVLNNPALAAQLLPYTTVIYRRKKSAGDDANNDDDAQAHSDAAEFIRLRHEEAPPGAFLYATNEPGKADAARLNTWTLAALEAARALGRKLCILNWATGNPEPEDWNIVAPSIELNNRYGGLNGVHGYWMGAPNTTPSYPYHVGRYFDAVRHFGGNWVVTEVGANKDKGSGQPDPYAGWMTFRDEGVYADDAEIIATQHAELGIGVCYFSYPEWDGHGFDVSRATQKLQPRWIVLNQTYKVNGVPMAPPPIYPEGSAPATKVIDVSAGLKLRTLPSLSGTLVRVMAYRETVTVYGAPVIPMDGYSWQRVTDSKGLVGWAANAVEGKPSWVDPVVPDASRVVIADMPYVNEFNWRAGWTALCGETSLYMLLLYDRQWRHVALPPEITPLSIAAYLGKGAKDFTSMEELRKAADAYGMRLHLDTGLWTDPLSLLTTEIDKKNPVICLLDYSKLPTRWDQGFGGGHILVAVGYSDQSIVVHDPDSLNGAGKFVSYPRTDFKAAWAAMGSMALVLG